MIAGTVDASYGAMISLRLSGPTGMPIVIEALIDTGFTGYLTVTPEIATELRLPHLSSAQALIADGSLTAFPVFGVTVDWDGQPVAVEAEGADTTPLVGMRLLDGYRLRLDVHLGGRVTMEPSV